VAAEYDVAVIGGGAAGLVAAGHAAASGARVACFEATALYGGLIANVGRLDDYPASQPLPGPALADILVARARTLGVTLVEGRVTGLASEDGTTRIATERDAYRARRTIIASGASLRRAGMPGETELAGRGVSQCSWCDGGLFRGERVVVVGGGDAALQSALHLAEICQSVAIGVRGATLRARNEYAARAADNERIRFHWETVVESVLGARQVEGVRLRDLSTNTSLEHPCDGVFVFVGLPPNCAFAPPDLAKDGAGYIRTDPQFRTSLPGTFAVGAVRSGHGGALLSAMGEAAAASAIAIDDLKQQGHL